MKFNIIRIGNRNYVDIGDIATCLYDLSLKKNDLDNSTLATVISACSYIASKFAEKQPKENTIYEVAVADGIFHEEVKRVFKENKKSLPKGNEPFIVIDEETYTYEKFFTEAQIAQFKDLLISQNSELKKVFEEAVKGIKINVTPPAPTTSGTGKKKTPAD